MDNAALLSAAAKWTRAAYRRDRSNRYALLQPWVLPPVRSLLVGVAPFAFDGDLVSCRPGQGGASPPGDGFDRIVVTVHPYSADSGVCDGCSYAPDLPGCVEAALFHDAWYLEMDRMAEATGIPVSDLRRLGDAIFGCIARALGAPGPVARVYHAFCRWFGGLLHGHIALLLAALFAGVFEGLGLMSMPSSTAERSDIVQALRFERSEQLIEFCRVIQSVSPVDSFVVPEPWAMPGYTDEVIMAAGAFIQGSSIELSADGPIREPYTAYIQGGLTYSHGRIAAEAVLDELLK